jgi:hypothetical protein
MTDADALGKGRCRRFPERCRIIRLRIPEAEETSMKGIVLAGGKGTVCFR